MRINKFLAENGVGSRRYCDDLIAQGKVLVNGRKCSLGQDVSSADDISVDGATLSKGQKEKVYLLMNKPKGCICSVSDDRGRKTIMDLLSERDRRHRLFPVGRLDYDSEGLLILTNDGELCDRLTHPRNEVPKTYSVKLENQISEEALNTLRAGVEIEPRVIVKAVNAKITEVTKEFTKLEITIIEGKNRQVRRMFEQVGKEVQFLKRVKVGDLRISGVDRGSYRRLTQKEVEYLLNV